eukprot:7085615-Prymnesium_polylepis.1
MGAGNPEATRRNLESTRRGPKAARGVTQSGAAVILKRSAALCSRTSRAAAAAPAAVHQQLPRSDPHEFACCRCRTSTTRSGATA